MEEIKKVINDWIKHSRNVPEDYMKFFNQWILLNLYYNAKYPELENEVEKVLELGKSYKNLFGKIMSKREYITALIKEECVGKGRSISIPSKYVKNATLQLREKLEIENGCENCREEKRGRCQEINPTEYIFEPFEAILRIIYQIRCNLFHGDKVILFGEQFERDKILIEASSSILEILLNHIIS